MGNKRGRQKAAVDWEEAKQLSLLLSNTDTTKHPAACNVYIPLKIFNPQRNWLFLAQITGELFLWSGFHRAFGDDMPIDIRFGQSTFLSDDKYLNCGIRTLCSTSVISKHITGHALEPIPSIVHPRNPLTWDPSQCYLFISFSGFEWKFSSSSFHQSFVHAPCVPILATCPAHPSRLDFTILAAVGGPYKVQRSSLCKIPNYSLYPFQVLFSSLFPGQHVMYFLPAD